MAELTMLQRQWPRHKKAISRSDDLLVSDVARQHLGKVFYGWPAADLCTIDATEPMW